MPRNFHKVCTQRHKWNAPGDRDYSALGRCAHINHCSTKHHNHFIQLDPDEQLCLRHNTTRGHELFGADPVWCMLHSGARRRVRNALPSAKKLRATRRKISPSAHHNHHHNYDHNDHNYNNDYHERIEDRDIWRHRRGWSKRHLFLQSATLSTGLCGLLDGMGRMLSILQFWRESALLFD